MDNKNASSTKTTTFPLLHSEKAWETNLSPQVEKWIIEIYKTPRILCSENALPSISFIFVWSLIFRSLHSNTESGHINQDVLETKEEKEMRLLALRFIFLLLSAMMIIYTEGGKRKTHGILGKQFNRGSSKDERSGIFSSQLWTGPKNTNVFIKSVLTGKIDIKRFPVLPNFSD